MNEGLIEQSGTPEQIYEYPKNAVCRPFVGFDNCIEGTIVEMKAMQSMLMSGVLSS